VGTEAYIGGAPTAILKKYKDELEDLEHTEILSFLRRLPAMDMDQVCLSVCLSVCLCIYECLCMCHGAVAAQARLLRWCWSVSLYLCAHVWLAQNGRGTQILTEAGNLKDDASLANL
jgi:hypothetical protein